MNMQFRIDHMLWLLMVLTIITMGFMGFAGEVAVTIILGLNVYWIAFYLNVFFKATNQNPPKVVVKKKKDFRKKMKDAAKRKDK